MEAAGRGEIATMVAKLAQDDAKQAKEEITRLEKFRKESHSDTTYFAERIRQLKGV